MVFILCIFNGGSTDVPKRHKNQCPGHGSGTSHCHRTKILKMGRPEIGCYIGNKANKINSDKKERHITYPSVFRGKLNKGNGQKYWGNASVTTNTTSTHCHPYCTSRAQRILQQFGTGRADGICPGLHTSCHPKNLGKILNVQGMC